MEHQVISIVRYCMINSMVMIKHSSLSTGAGAELESSRLNTMIVDWVSISLLPCLVVDGLVIFDDLVVFEGLVVLEVG